jgi:hypothetical protein
MTRQDEVEHYAVIFLLFYMEEVWSVVGHMIDDLGGEILEITRELDEAHIAEVKQKMRSRTS